MWELIDSLPLPPVIWAKFVQPETTKVIPVAHLCYPRHLLLRELKRTQLGQVVLQPALIRARRERNQALIQDPPQPNLGLGNAILARQLRPHGVDGPALGPRQRKQRAVARNSNIVLLVERDQVAVLEIRVVLDLVNSGDHLGRLEDDLDVLLEEVGDADGLGLARGLDGLEVGPLLLQLLVRGGEPGPVEEVEVDVVEAQLLEGQLEGFLRGLLLLAVRLGGDEELAPGDAGRLDGRAELFFVSVHWALVSASGVLVGAWLRLPSAPSRW